jgi:4-oxalocrotonate tautomerase
MPVVTITMAKGRSYEQKKELTDQIAVTVKNVLGVPIERVTIFVHELEKENISIAGALLSEQK